MSAPLTFNELLDQTVLVLGENAFSFPQDQWLDATRELSVKLESVVGRLLGQADVWMNPTHLPKLSERVNLWQGPGPTAATVTLRPPKEFYLAQWGSPEEFYPDPDQDLYLQFDLGVAMPSSWKGYFTRPQLFIELGVGGQMLGPLEWVTKNWRRPFEQMVLPLKCDFNFDDWNIPARRDKDSLKSLEECFRLEGDDRGWSFTWMKGFTSDAAEEDLVRVVSVFAAIFDSIYQLKVKRCDPDRFFKHFLKLKPRLERSPFREGFFEIQYVTGFDGKPVTKLDEI